MHRVLLLVAVLVAVVLAGAAEVYTQDSTPDEQTYVERLVQRLVSAPGRPVEVQGIGISLSGDVTAERIAVRDERGAWLVIEDFVLDWSPLSLFTSRLRIDALTAQRMTVLRRPEAAPQAEAPEEAAGLTAADIDRLLVEELIVEAPVVGTPARLRVRGSGAIAQSPPAITFDLSATRIDDIDGQLSANIVYEQRTGHLDLDLVLAEQRGGLVQRLLALENDPMVDLRVVGSGPLDDWNGDLRLALNGEAVVTGNARVAGVDGGTVIETQLNGDFTAVAPTTFDPLFPGRSELAAAVMLDDAGALRIESAVLRSEAADVVIDGLIDIAAAELVLSLTGQLAYAETVAFDAGAVDKLAFEGRLSGPFKAPEWEFNATAETITATGVAGRDLTLEIAGSGLPLAEDQRAEARVIASGVLEPVERALPPLVAGRFLADLTLDLPGDGRIVLETGHVETPSAALDASGYFAPSDGRYDLTVEASAQSPQTGQAMLDRLLEGTTRFAGRVSGTTPDTMTLHDVALTSDVVEAQVSGRLTDDEMEVAAQAVINDLARLDERARGAVEIEASLVGPRQAPRAEIAGRGREVALMGKPFRDVSFEATATLDAATPTGEVRLTGTLDQRPVDITANVGAAAEGGQDVTLAAIIGSARIDADLVLAPDAAPRGRLLVAAPDLSHLGPLLLAELSGSLDAEIALADEAGRSQAVITAAGRNIGYGGLSAASLDADVTVEDLFGTPRPAGTARLRQLRAGGLELATVDAEATTIAPGTFAVSLHAAGPRLRFAARTRTEVADGVFLVHAEELSGIFEGIDMALAAPAAIRIDGADIEIDRAEIAVGSGRLILAGSLGPELTATIEAREVPLNVAAQAFPDLAPAGTISGTATLSGSREAPRARFTLSGRGVAVAALRDYGLPPVGLEAEGEYAEQRLTFTATASGPQASQLAVAGTVATEPVRLDVAVRGPVSSDLVADRLAQAGVRLDATLDLDLRITGPVDDIAVTGVVTTSGATVGDLEGRFLVRQASGRIVLDEQSVRIERLEGTTGRNGRAAISGAVSLNAPHQADLSIAIERGQYNDGTLLVTTFDAELALTGPLAGAPRLAGRIDLIGPQLTLNEPPPVALAPLEVMHVNAPPLVRRQAATLVARRGQGGGTMELDIELVVRDRFLVRGRGLNAELDGRLRLTGSLNNLSAIGGFRLQRGHLNLLGRRFEIERGRLDFTGNLDPRIAFTAIAFREGFTIEMNVTGRATTPEITVTSSPELPQEEALARLIFGSSLTQLSPFQIAQLASAVATLSGGGGGGLFDGIGNALGLDRFEVFENEAGETTVAVGRRVHERVSLGVEQGREPGSTRVNIDIDVTRQLKVRGSMGRDGSTKAGVFFQTDY